MANEKRQSSVVPRVLSSVCGSGWFHQGGGGGDGDDDEQRGSWRCRSCVSACYFGHLDGGDDDCWCQLVSYKGSKTTGLTDGRVHGRGDDDGEHFSSSCPLFRWDHLYFARR